MKSDFCTTPSGQKIEIYTLTNSLGSEARITTIGGALVSLKVPDRRGNLSDIVLGYDSVEGYLDNHPNFGVIVGRYANRISRGQFSLDGHAYQLDQNDGQNHIHGGAHGIGKAIWTAHSTSSDPPSLQLKYTSKDGEEGYPGNLSITITYTLTDQNELRIDYLATTDQATIVNLTEHSYFNLAGQGQGDVLDHRIQINADRFTPVNSELIPTGEIREVKGTPFDFRESRVIGDQIGVRDPQLARAKGFDHNFILNGDSYPPRLAARVSEPTSGRVLEVYTTQPGLQFYTGNSLLGHSGKDGNVYAQYSGFCLETQHFPDSPNQPEFPSTTLRPGTPYRSTTIYKFSVDHT